MYVFVATSNRSSLFGGTDPVTMCHGTSEVHATPAVQLAGAVKSFSLSPCVNVVESGSTFNQSRNSSPVPNAEPSTTFVIKPAAGTVGAHVAWLLAHFRAEFDESTPELLALTQSTAPPDGRLPSISKLTRVV